MSADTDPDDGEGDTTQIRVPTHLIKRIDDEYSERGYASRSEAIRDALRTWADPPVQLSDEILADLETSRQQAEAGETHSAEAVRERLGLDDSDDDADSAE